MTPPFGLTPYSYIHTLTNDTFVNLTNHDIVNYTPHASVYMFRSLCALDLQGLNTIYLSVSVYNLYFFSVLMHCLTRNLFKSALKCITFSCYISMFYFIILDSVSEDVTSEDLKHLPYLECVLKVRYLTNRLHFFVCVYCNRSHITSERVKNKYVRHETKSSGVTCSLHVVTSSVIYYSTHNSQQESFIFRNWSRLSLEMYIFTTLKFTSLYFNVYLLFCFCYNRNPYDSFLLSHCLDEKLRKT